MLTTHNICKEKSLCFVYHLPTALPYQVSSDIALEACRKNGYENISIIDVYGDCSLTDRRVTRHEVWDANCVQSLFNVDYAFCGFYQDIAIIVNTIPEPLLPKKIVNIWHGMPIRTIGFQNPIERQSPLMLGLEGHQQRIHHCVQSDFYRDVFVSAFNTSKEQVHRIGNLRTEVPQKTLPVIIGEKKISKTVLYAPTNGRRQYSSLSERMGVRYNLLELNNFLLENHILLLVKQHDQELPIPLSSSTNILPFNEYFSRQGKTSASEVISNIDILITDCSSLAIDAIDFKTPLIMLSPTPEYLRSNPLLFSKSDLYGNSPKTFDDLCDAICAATNGKFRGQPNFSRLLDINNKANRTPSQNLIETIIGL